MAESDGRSDASMLRSAVEQERGSFELSDGAYEFVVNREKFKILYFVETIFMKLRKSYEQQYHFKLDSTVDLSNK